MKSLPKGSIPFGRLHIGTFKKLLIPHSKRLEVRLLGQLGSDRKR